MTPTIESLTPEDLLIIQADPTLRKWFELRTDNKKVGIVGFQPRPDNPAMFDQQSSFCYSTDLVSFLIKGNASGGTESAAYKTARYLLQVQPPPRKNTPFWIISDTYDQCIDVCWGEKLYGHGYILDDDIEWDGVKWLSEKAGQPKWVPLKPWPVERGGDPEKNWALEFKSYEQGRSKMQARSIGGFWFSEQFPWEIFNEVLRGCREYMFPGGQFCEFTPIDPDLCTAVEKVMDDPPPGWAFYRANTACNKANLATDWYDQFFASVPEEMLATRQTGALAVFQGVIFQSFTPSIHVIEDDDFLELPGLTHYRAIDWGDSEEHPTACVWGVKDLEDNWYVYDEYWENSQGKTTADHAIEILARSLAWGWPTPREIANPVSATRHVAMAVHARLDEMCPNGVPEWTRKNHHYGTGWADHRLGDIAEFNRYGIYTGMASKADVYASINYVRTLLKVSPFTGEPRLFINKRCQHLVDEMRRYRWDKNKTAKPQPLKRDEDVVDALRYLVYSETRSGDAPPGSVDTKHRVKQRKGIPLDRGGALMGELDGMMAEIVQNASESRMRR